MLEASRRISSVRVLEEAFRIGISSGKMVSVVKKDPMLQKQLTLIGKMLCLMMFAFRSGRESPETINEIETIRNE